MVNGPYLIASSLTTCSPPRKARASFRISSAFSPLMATGLMAVGMSGGWEVVFFGGHDSACEVRGKCLSG